MTITTITITDSPDGSVDIKMFSDHVSGQPFSTGVKLASRMVKASDQLMVEHNYKPETTDDSDAHCA